MDSISYYSPGYSPVIIVIPDYYCHPRLRGNDKNNRMYSWLDPRPRLPPRAGEGGDDGNI